MVKHDFRLTEDEINEIKNFVGATFDKYIADNAFGGTKAIQYAVFSIDGKNYVFSNVTQPFDYYGNGIEDVAFFRFDKADDSRVANETSFERSIVIPVGLQVENIEIVTEIQKVFEKGKQIYEIVLTRGVIFNFADDFQISFEKDIWFSELINIQKGYNLIAKFNPATDFEENWTGDFNARSERTVECVTQS